MQLNVRRISPIARRSFKSISHAGTVVLRQRKSMEEWEIRPPLPQKPLNGLSTKFAWVITS